MCSVTSAARRAFAPAVGFRRSPRRRLHQRTSGQHLSLSGSVSDFAALLLDARWIETRGKLGGLLGLQGDFDIDHRMLEKAQKEEASG